MCTLTVVHCGADTPIRAERTVWSSFLVVKRINSTLSGRCQSGELRPSELTSAGLYQSTILRSAFVLSFPSCCQRSAHEDRTHPLWGEKEEEEARRRWAEPRTSPTHQRPVSTCEALSADKGYPTLTYITGLLSILLTLFITAFLALNWLPLKVKMENDEKYLPELLAEKDSLDSSFTHAMKLLNTGKVCDTTICVCMCVCASYVLCMELKKGGTASVNEALRNYLHAA